MNRITTLFQNRDKKILSLYFTAGYPKLDQTLEILKSIESAGGDLVEIGMPFSDPLADGPVIQASSQQALKNGMSLQKLFKQLKGFRKEISIPVVLMGYLNPVLQFGMEAFLKNCQQVGVDGLILPDLPLNEYERTYKNLFSKYQIDLIFLVTPETSKERLQEIDRVGTGFIYAVSSSSTTGSDKSWNKLEEYFQHLANSSLQNPVLTGFGVKDKDSFTQASKHTQGAIIGTAFIKVLTENKDNLSMGIKEFIQGIRRN